MKVNLGGLVPLSTVDWIGFAATVVFLRGCPLRCPHCQNRGLQQGESLVDLSYLRGEIEKSMGNERSRDQITLQEAVERTRAKPFVSALVISGGEPLLQPQAAGALLRLAKGLRLKTGLETSGYYPDQLRELLEANLVDRLFLDLKADLREPCYQRATGMKEAAARVRESLRICMQSGVAMDARTTIFPEMPDAAEVVEIAKTLAGLKAEFPEHGLESLVLQQGRPEANEFEPVTVESLNILAERIKDLVEVQIRVAPKAKMDNEDNSSSRLQTGEEMEA